LKSRPSIKFNHRFVRNSKKPAIDREEYQNVSDRRNYVKVKTRKPCSCCQTPPKINIIPKMLFSRGAEIRAQTDKINCFGFGRGIRGSVRFSPNCQLIGNSANSMRFSGPSAICQLIDIAASLGRWTIFAPRGGERRTRVVWWPHQTTINFNERHSLKNFAAVRKSWWHRCRPKAT